MGYCASLPGEDVFALMEKKKIGGKGGGETKIKHRPVQTPEKEEGGKGEREEKELMTCWPNPSRKERTRREGLPITV